MLVKARVEVSFRPGSWTPRPRPSIGRWAAWASRACKSVRRAKVIEVELAASDRASAEAQLKAMCERLLANPVIETYRISLAD